MSWHQKFGSLYVDVSAATDKLKRGLQRAEDMSRRSGNRAGRMFQKAFGGLSNLGIGRGLVGGVGAAGLLAMAKSSVVAADSIGKTADKIGLTTDALQELRYAAGQSGVASATLDMAMQRFTRRTAEAAMESGEAKDALKELGVTMNDLQTKSPSELLRVVADRLMLVDNQATRVRLAFKLFDSEGVAMINMLRGGGKALDDYARKLHDMGGVVEERLIRKAETAKDRLDDLSKSFRGKLTTAILENADALNVFADTLINVIEKLGKVATSVSKIKGLWAAGKGNETERDMFLMSDKGLTPVNMGLDSERAAKSAQKYFNAPSASVNAGAVPTPISLDARRQAIAEADERVSRAGQQNSPADARLRNRVAQYVTINGGNFAQSNELFEEVKRLKAGSALTP